MSFPPFLQTRCGVDVTTLLLVPVLSSTLSATTHSSFAIRFISHSTLLQSQFGGGGAIPYSPEIVADIIANLVHSVKVKDGWCCLTRIIHVHSDQILLSSYGNSIPCIKRCSACIHTSRWSGHFQSSGVS